jgi:hypothetical protein
MRLTPSQFEILRRALAEAPLPLLSTRLTPSERRKAFGLAHRSTPLLSAAPFHLWDNPCGPTYTITAEGRSVLSKRYALDEAAPIKGGAK